MEESEHLCDIIVLCHSDVIDELTKAFEAVMEGLNEQVYVLSNGLTTRYGMGVIVLECHGPIPPALQRELETNKNLTDWVNYPVPTYDNDEEPSGKE